MRPDDSRELIRPFPFLLLKEAFFMAEKIFPLALSTAPLDWGWYTDAKHNFVPIDRQYSLKSWQSNCFPLSIVSSLGTPNLQMIFCQKNFLIVAEVMVARGLASIHFVKYSTATTANLKLPWAVGSGPTMSIPQRCSVQVGVMSCDGAPGLRWCFAANWQALQVFTMCSASFMAIGQ
jgi:hypothetical protein